MAVNSCYGCQKRHEGCHSTCPDYLEYRADLDRIKELKLAEKKGTPFIPDSVMRNIGSNGSRVLGRSHIRKTKSGGYR